MLIKVKEEKDGEEKNEEEKVEKKKWKLIEKSCQNAKM